MKILALLSGLLASAFAWVAGVYLTDIGVQFLELWPDTISQQFLGLVTWHAIVAAALVGGVLAVASPISGVLLLTAVGAGWAWLAYTLPVGFVPQTIVPIVLSGLGALAAVGAALRGRARRMNENRRPTPEELEREEALRFEPSEDAPAHLNLDLDLPPEREPAVADIVPPPERPRRGDDVPPHGISGIMATNVAVLLLLAAAVGILVYSELRSGDLAAAFSPSGPRAAHVTEGAPSVPAAATAEGPQATETPDGADTTDAASPQVLAEDSEDLQVASLDGGLDDQPIAAPDDGPWPDPFSYCAAVETIDFPDHRYAGPHLVGEIADALRVPESASPDRVKWRCYEGAVLACAAFDGPVCAMTPSVAEMVAFCAQNPGARDLMAPNGSWSCNGVKPEIPSDQNWPVDPRGFLPGVWQAVAPPGLLSQ